MKTISIIVSAIIAVGLTGCAGQPLDTKILNQHNQTWVLNSANTHYKDGVVKVSGYMKPSKIFGARKGHIDIIAKTSDGQELMRETAPLGRRVMRKGGNYFSLEHKADFPEDTIITVEYHNQENLHD